MRRQRILGAVASEWVAVCSRLHFFKANGRGWIQAGDARYRKPFAAQIFKVVLSRLHGIRSGQILFSFVFSKKDQIQSLLKHKTPPTRDFVVTGYRPPTSNQTPNNPPPHAAACTCALDSRTA